MTNQINTVLPRSAWDSVTIEENGEPLMELRNTPCIRLASGIKHYQPSFFIRKSVAKKLERVARLLPDEFTLVVIEAFRDMDSQQQEWDRVFANIKQLNPSLPDETIEQRVWMLVAKPHPLANHHCGGAVDVTLSYYIDDTLVDMGTPYISQITDMNDKEKISMLSSSVTDEQKFNRAILRKAMEREGFVWYPGEWWHYCYGDRMWAVYSRQQVAMYGSIELE